MRLLRTVLSVVLALIVASGLTVALSASATAANAGTASASAPKRVVTEEDPGEHQVTFNAFRLKGWVSEPVFDPLTGLPVLDPATGEQAVTPYAKQKVKLQRKKCGSCKWKKAKKLKTNKFGAYKTRLFAPRKGKWKWRVKVSASGGYAATKGKTWTTGFR